MSIVDVESVLAQVDELLAKAKDLPEVAALAVEKLLNVVEVRCSDRKKLVEEVRRLREQLDQKKKDKNWAMLLNAVGVGNQTGAILDCRHVQSFSSPAQALRFCGTGRLARLSH